MKKTILIALFAAAFVVGCSAQDKPDATAYRDNAISSADHKPKCKNCKGKLGLEKVSQDIAK